MDSYVLGVDMMHSECTNKSGSDDGSGELSPCVAPPMNKAGDEIYKELRSDKAKQGGKGSIMKSYSFNNEFDP